jgi:opacity protein-like surface antigen
MIVKKNKIYLGVALATLTMAGAMVSPQASALTKAERMAEAANNKAEVLEAQLRAMQDEIASLRAQVSGTAPAAADSQKVQELDAWMNSVKSEPVKAKNRDENLIFFRGGYARNDSKRNDILTGNQVGSGLGATDLLGGGLSAQDGYYVGAGFDFGLTDDIWGLMDDTQVLAELMFDYRNFGEQNFGAGTNPLATTVNAAVGGGLANSVPAVGTSNTNRVTVTQFTLGASPKIKFMKGSAFQPWLIPFGLTVNVISPPSNGVTVLNPGMQFGTGAEYAIWKAIKVGVDVRYNLTGRSVDGVNTNGLTAGGYLGIGF